jgi:hypothetical protein
MFEKIKDIGAQAATTANAAAGGISTSLKSGIESMTNTAVNVTEVLNEKAVRTSTAQLCNVLEIAIAELKNRSLSEHPVSLTATVNIGISALEMQIHLQPSEKKDEPKGVAT